MNKSVRLFLIAAFIAWMVGWYRIFGYSFSAAFFRYYLGPRLPILILVLFATAVPPLSGYWAVSRTLRQKVGAVKACALNLVISGLPLFIFWAFLALRISGARRAGELAFEADEAMGIGIDFLLCEAIFLATNITVICILVTWKLIRRKKNGTVDAL